MTKQLFTNAFVQIIAQLVEQIEPLTWKEQKFFTFNELLYPSSILYDACIFRQSATGALGLLWIKFDNYSFLLVMPFRLARYSEDGDLISLSPWSLRDASADSEFFEAWKNTMHNKTHILTAKGAYLRRRSSNGRPNIQALKVFSDEKSICVRVETQEAIKIFKIISDEKDYISEVDILEYLNQQKIFLNYSELISVYEYEQTNGMKSTVAISTKYIENNGHLWHEMLSYLQQARFPELGHERRASETWQQIIKISEALGRMLGEFHRAMIYARDNRYLMPEVNSLESRKIWTTHIIERITINIKFLQKIDCFKENFYSLYENIEAFYSVLIDRVNKIETLGLKIRIHGRVHLGHIFNTQNGLYLFAFIDDRNDYCGILKHKQSSLEDLASLVLSLKYAWYMTEHKSLSPIMGEFLSPNELNKEINYRVAIKPEQSRNFIDIEQTLIRFYMRVIDEDTSSTELVPSQKFEFNDLYDLMFFLRIIEEVSKDYEIGNPRLKTSLKILSDFYYTVLRRTR